MITSAMFGVLCAMIALELEQYLVESIAKECIDSAERISYAKTQDPRPKTQDPRPKTQDPRPKTQDPSNCVYMNARHGWRGVGVACGTKNVKLLCLLDFCTGK